jgi:hypothetical protein
MDYQWAEGQLRGYEQAVRDCGMMQVLSKDRRKALSNLNLRLPHINGILISLTPTTASSRPPTWPSAVRLSRPSSGRSGC